ncbi:MAG: hypothetical protein CL424_16185 [Acidimicrobiaceae bacterium]|nr:hypothetical protein [Acidimicrobiaceae bacterium]
MTDLGGEPACWAHLEDELDTRRETDRVTHVGVTQLVSEGNGALWSLPNYGDLDANVVQLDADQAIGEHINHDVDVFIVVWDGTGEVAIDDRPLPVRPGVALLVPKGTSRTIRADADGMTHLTVHRRRGHLAIGRH